MRLPGNGKKKCGGMGTEQLKGLKWLQKENERLPRAVSDLTLDELILNEAASGTAGPRSETSEPSRSSHVHQDGRLRP